jgi:hypothetical protein
VRSQLQLGQPEQPAIDPRREGGGRREGCWTSSVVFGDSCTPASLDDPSSPSVNGQAGRQSKEWGNAANNDNFSTPSKQEEGWCW